MAKRKLERFAQIETFGNVLTGIFKEGVHADHAYKGKWREAYFKNANPIVLELGCGKGEYTVGLAKHYPEKNFIGMDIKGARIWAGAKEALETKLTNAAFIRSKIDFILSFFAEGEVDEIWLTFSDPQPGKARKRLSSPLFTARYRKIMRPDGVIHLKTDSDLLFDYTIDEISEHYRLLESYPNLYAQLGNISDVKTRELLQIKTHYETLFTAKGHVIKYCKFSLQR